MFWNYADKTVCLIKNYATLANNLQVMNKLVKHDSNAVYSG